MKKAQAREMRQAFKAMTDEELKEAVKEIPSEILAGELYERLVYAENRNVSIKKIANCSR